MEIQTLVTINITHRQRNIKHLTSMTNSVVALSCTGWENRWKIICLLFTLKKARLQAVYYHRTLNHPATWKLYIQCTQKLYLLKKSKEKGQKSFVVFFNGISITCYFLIKDRSQSRLSCTHRKQVNIPSLSS